MAKKPHKSPQQAAKEAEQKAAATQAELIANFRINPGDKFTYSTFVRYVRDAGIKSDALPILENLIKTKKVAKQDGLGMSFNTIFYEAL